MPWLDFAKHYYICLASQFFLKKNIFLCSRSFHTHYRDSSFEQSWQYSQPPTAHTNCLTGSVHVLSRPVLLSIRTAAESIPIPFEAFMEALESGRAIQIPVFFLHVTSSYIVPPAFIH